MYTKIKNFFFLIFFTTFIFLIVNYYFSEKNKIFIAKSRTNYEIRIDQNKINLPILRNDTDNIIIYKNDLEEFKSKRKKRFWEKLISNSNE